MKFKLFTACAVMLCAVAFAAERLVIPVTITTTATRTVYTNVVTVPTPNVGAVPGSMAVYRALDKIVVKNNTLSSASVAVAMEDLDEWTTLTGSPVVAATTAQTVGYPWRGVTESIAGYVVTNDVPVSVTSTVTKYVPYPVHRLRMITTLNETNAASTVNAAVHFQ